MAIRFQVDPDFYDHPKSIGMSDAATALWVRAGSYSAAKLLDGFIAEHVLSTLSRSPEEASAELVARGLWRRTKGGYQFHQYGERNLLKAQVEAEREADRERKRQKRIEAKGSTVRPDSTSDAGTDSMGKPAGVLTSRVGVVSMSVSSSGRRPRRRPKPHPFVDDGSGETCELCSLAPSNATHVPDPEAAA